MPLYFAYGSCMSLKDLARTVDAKLLGPATLNDYRLAFTKYSKGRQGGVADVIPAAGDYVEGVLFEVDDFQELDKREGAPKFYQRTLVEVVPVNSNPVSVTTYTVVKKSTKDIKPSKEYLRIILDGATNLSAEYQEKLRNYFFEFYDSI